MGRQRKKELKLISNRKRRCVTFQKRKKGLEKRDERKNDVNAVKYPTWNERLNRMSACELRNVISELDVKVKAAEERIDFLKGKRITVSPQTPDPPPPPPPVSRRLVGTSSLQMESIQQTSYNINPAMINPLPYHHRHDGRHLVAAATEVRVTKNRVMMTKVEPMPSSLLSCAQPAAVMRPYLQNLPAATLPYGCNLPAAVIPYGQYQWMHYSDNVMRSGYYP